MPDSSNCWVFFLFYIECVFDIIINMGKKIDLKKEDIEELYINQNLTRTKVAERLNINEGTLKQKMKRMGIKKPSDLHTKNIEKSCLEKYGVKNAGGISSSLEKTKQTNRVKFGCDWALQSSKVINKRKNTNLDRYGVENVFSSDEIKNKIKETNVNRYGVEHATQSEQVKEKTKNTNKERYGVEYYTQTDEYKTKTQQTCLEKYGETSFTKTQAYRDLYKNSTFVDNKVISCIETKKKRGVLFKSKLEKEITNFIKNELKIEGDTFIKGTGDKRFEIDYYMKNKNVGIEINGCWWHSVNAQDHKNKNYHFNKMLQAREMGIDLIQIWEDQWHHKKEIIKDILRARLGVVSNKIYARNCVIKIIDNKTYKEFCNKNHIQGYRPATIKFGLFYNEKLVQIASFNLCRNYGKRKAECEWEWIRGCIASNNVVIGGTSRLLKRFIKECNPKSILCYADANLFNGKGYDKAGFNFVGYTGPDKFYVENNHLIRHTRNPYKYREFKDGVKSGKYMECYGAGSMKFVWKSN